MKQDPVQISRWFFAELIGTALLAATVGVGAIAHFGLLNGYNSLYIPFAVGGVVMVLVYLFGGVSGAHFNPAVSVALFAFKKMKVAQLITYLFAQFIGAWLGVKLVVELVGIPPSAPEIANRAAGFGEMIGTFILVFAIMSFVLGKFHEALGGLVIGTALAIGLTLAMVTGAGFLNPAVSVAFGTNELLVYLLMPLLGGLVGAAAAVLFNEK